MTQTNIAELVGTLTFGEIHKTFGEQTTEVMEAIKRCLIEFDSGKLSKESASELQGYYLQCKPENTDCSFKDNSRRNKRARLSGKATSKPQEIS